MPSKPRVHRPTTAVPLSRPRQKRPDRRPSARERGYTWGWEQYSRGYLGRNPLCFYCRAIGRVTAAEHTDHYNPCEPDSPEWWAEDNHRPSCAYHNSAKQDIPGDVYLHRLTERHRMTQITAAQPSAPRSTVYGPPGAGKTTAD